MGQDPRLTRVGSGQMKRRRDGDAEPPPDVPRLDGPQLTVMTRNLCFGTDLAPILEAKETEFMNAVAAAYDRAVATDFPGRARVWAAEIELAHPDLIGLQEAVIFVNQPDPGGNSPPAATTIDLVDLLLGELRQRNLDYEIVAVQVGQEFKAPGMFASGVAMVTLTQADVILANKGSALTISNRQGGKYKDFASAKGFDLTWGWASVDVTLAEHAFLFATTHLDPRYGELQYLQAEEFLLGPGKTTMPVIWVGDFNSDAEGSKNFADPPATKTYRYILDSGFSDAWTAMYPPRQGYTCCQEINLKNPASRLDTRVDLVLTRGGPSVVDASLVGADTADQLPSGLWPSDHAGVVVTLQL